MPTEREHAEIRRRAAGRLLALPGVVAVGLGSKEVGDQPTGEAAIKVFVKVKRPASELAPDELIPAEIEGVQTDVVQSGEIELEADPPGAVVPVPAGNNGARPRPLTGGVRVRRKDAERGGTMGCLLVDTGDLSKIYGLTNYHVTAVSEVGAPVAGSSRLGQPTGKDSVTHCCSDLIGTFVGGAKSEERDEALIRLDPGTQWLAEIEEIGIVTGKHTITEPEWKSGTYKVRKRGVRTRLTGGTVRAVEATTHENDNLVIVKPNPNPAAGAQGVRFSAKGDSGAAYVNDAGEALALHYAGDESGNGHGHSINRVLEHFAAVEHINADVAVAVLPGTVNTVPGAAMVRTPPELVDVLGDAGRPAPARLPVPAPPPPGWAPQPVALSAGPPQLERDLDRSPAGRLLITVWLDHQQELLTLVNTNRRVAVAWHRSGASALFQALARMTVQPELALPTTVNGQPLLACLDRMQTVLGRFASARLRRDLARVRRLLPDVAGLTYPQIIDALGTG
jgi:hypothetical protein